MPAEVFERVVQTAAQDHPPGGSIDGRSGRLTGKGVLGLLGTGGWRLFVDLLWRFVIRRPEVWSRSGVSYFTPSAERGQPAPVLPHQSVPDLKIDRRVVRSVLLEAHRDSIAYSAAFTGYSVTEHNVTAHFADGTSAKGSLIVGADGVRSTVAKQLIGPGAALVDTGVRIIYGKTVLTAEVEKALHPVLQNGTSFVIDRTPQGYKTVTVVEAIRFTHEDAPTNYIFWAFSAKKEAFEMSDVDLSAAQGDMAKEIVCRMTASYESSLRVVFDRQSSTETAMIRVTSSNPQGPPAWETNSRVTVLGDAIHCMPPTGGAGGNTALYDAALLGKLLGAEKQSGKSGWSRDVIHNYERGMRYNVGDIVGLANLGLIRLLE